jgi:predicted ribosome quality control (RQC) complex YloA/Tae2 family protein
MAGRSDYWFHVQSIHGAHVILWTEGQEPDDQSMTEAALLAAWFSQGRGGSKIPVDFTRVKHVKKPAGAKPGMVIYQSYETTYVTPEEGLIQTLEANKG